MCSSSEAGSYLRLIDVVLHSTLGLIVIKKKTSIADCWREVSTCALGKSKLEHGKTQHATLRIVGQPKRGGARTLITNFIPVAI